MARNAWLYEQHQRKEIQRQKNLEEQSNAANRLNKWQETKRQANQRNIAKLNNDSHTRISNLPEQEQKTAAQQAFTNAKLNAERAPATAKRLFEGVIRNYPTSPEAKLAEAELQVIEVGLKAAAGHRGAVRF